MEDNTYAQFMEKSLKKEFEQNGTYAELRSALHVKVLQLLRGQLKLDKDATLCGGNVEQRGLLRQLNELIVDYFEWYGFKHTLETFAMETGSAISVQPREKLRQQLKLQVGQKQLDLPVLLQLLRQQQQSTAKADSKLPKKRTQAVALKLEKKASKLISRPAAQKRITLKPRVQVCQQLASAVKPTANTVISKKPATEQRKLAVKPRKATNTLPKSQPKTASEPTDEDGSCSTVDSEYNSDAFIDIPERYYYREEEPPEQAYAANHGEEGRCPSAQRFKPMPKYKPLQIYEKETKPKIKPTSSASASISVKERFLKRGKRGLFQSQRIVDQSEDEKVMPVSKPKCPETIISTIKLESDEESFYDSDNYL